MSTRIARDGAAMIGHRVPDRVPNERTAATDPRIRESRNHAGFRDGEGQNRTGDTTIFSRVLYQLSYLAGVAVDDGIYRWGP
jgi:hypothetical protein